MTDIAADERVDYFRAAVLAAAEAYNISPEEMVGLGLTMVTSFLTELIPDVEIRREAAREMLDEALIELDGLWRRER